MPKARIVSFAIFWSICFKCFVRSFFYTTLVRFATFYDSTPGLLHLSTLVGKCFSICVTLVTPASHHGLEQATCNFRSSADGLINRRWRFRRHWCAENSQTLPDFRVDIRGIVPQFGGKCFDITLASPETAAQLAQQGIDYLQKHKIMTLLGAKTIHVSIFVLVEFPDDDLFAILKQDQCKLFYRHN